MRRRLKSPASRLFTQPFIQAHIKWKYQSSASLAFVRGIHRWPVNSPHKGPVTRKKFPIDDVIRTNNARELSWVTTRRFFVTGTVITPYVKKVIDTLIARFMGPTWGPSGADGTQVGPMLVPWTLLSGIYWIHLTSSPAMPPSIPRYLISMWPCHHVI